MLRALGSRLRAENSQMQVLLTEAVSGLATDVLQQFADQALITAVAGGSSRFSQHGMHS